MIINVFYIEIITKKNKNKKKIENINKIFIYVTKHIFRREPEKGIIN